MARRLEIDSDGFTAEEAGWLKGWESELLRLRKKLFVSQATMFWNQIQDTRAIIDSLIEQSTKLRAKAKNRISRRVPKP